MLSVLNYNRCTSLNSHLKIKLHFVDKSYISKFIYLKSKYK